MLLASTTQPSCDLLVTSLRGYNYGYDGKKDETSYTC